MSGTLYRMPSRREVLEIAARLRQARLAIEPNASKFAAKAGIKQNAYSQYETGARPLTIAAAMRLCQAHGLSLDWLYRGDPVFMPHGVIERLSARP